MTDEERDDLDRFARLFQQVYLPQLQAKYNVFGIYSLFPFSDRSYKAPAVKLRLRDTLENAHSLLNFIAELGLLVSEYTITVIKKKQVELAAVVIEKESVNKINSQVIQKEYVTWEQAEQFVVSVIDDYTKRGYKPTGIYGIPRGGLCLATMLSYKTNLPLLLAPSPNCIIIDDIADSGKTLLHFTKNDTQFNDYYITTMYYAERSEVVPTFWQYKKDNKWIVFPWEGEV